MKTFVATMSLDELVEIVNVSYKYNSRDEHLCLVHNLKTIFGEEAMEEVFEEAKKNIK